MLNGKAKGRLGWFTTALAVGVLFAVVGVAFAEGAAHESSGRMLDLLYRCINFVLLVIILVVVLRKTSLKDFFARRREEIKDRMETLTRDKAAAEERYRELERKFKDFELQKKEIIAQFRAEGLAEKDKIIAQAKQRAEQILSQADVTLQREIQGAKDRLKEEIVDVAARKAQKLILSHIKDSDQDHLVDEFIDRVEKLH